jgi:hypothetical protein
MASVTNAIAVTQCNAAVDAIDAGSGAGILVFYAGTVPANVETALAGGNTVLATVTFADPAFGGAVDSTPGATATASAITGANAVATGDATFARAFTSDPGVCLQFTVAGSTGGSGEILITSADADAGITSGLPVSVSAFTYYQPEA